MEPLALASSAVALLLPYLAKGAEAAAGELGKRGVGVGEKIFVALRARWTGKPEAENLNALKDNPDAARAPVIEALEREIKGDTSFADALAALVNQAAPEFVIEMNINQAETLVGAKIGKASRGKLSAKISGGKVSSATGFEIDEFG